MKKLIFAILLLALNKSIAQQCFRGSCGSPNVTAAVIIDNSLRYYGPTGFSGFGVHAGVWVDWLGFTAGGVESKINAETIATREAVFTMLGRYTLANEKVQISPFFSVGTNNFQDIGIRAGWYILNSAYVGVVASRTMHYGITIMVSVNHSK